MDDSDRVGYLLGVLDFVNMPKVVKKKALYEACRILGLKFSMDDMEAIETKFSLLEKEAGELVRCPLCKKRILLRTKTAFVEHLNRCPRAVRKHASRGKRKGRSSRR